VSRRAAHDTIAELLQTQAESDNKQHLALPSSPLVLLPSPVEQDEPLLQQQQQQAPLLSADDGVAHAAAPAADGTVARSATVAAVPSPLASSHTRNHVDHSAAELDVVRALNGGSQHGDHPATSDVAETSSERHSKSAAAGAKATRSSCSDEEGAESGASSSAQTALVLTAVVAAGVAVWWHRAWLEERVRRFLRR
jgi:cobalamin biosynthesis Mg chelatase CobN